MPTIPIEQAIYGNPDVGGYRFLARSPGFNDEWLTEAERLCAGFGERPAGVACPGCVFAQPFGDRHVAVVQVADQGSDDAGRPGALAFYLLVLPRRAYQELVHDPFLVAERFPPAGRLAASCRSSNGPPEVPPHRTVEQVQQVLKEREQRGPAGRCPGAGGQRANRLRSAGAGQSIAAQPLDAVAGQHALRISGRPASPFDNSLGFDVLAVPRAEGPAYCRLSHRGAGRRLSRGHVTS